MPLLQNKLVSARQLKRKLEVPLPKCKSRRKRQGRIPPRLSMLHQHDKKLPDNQLHPVFHLHPLLLRQSILLVSSKKLLPVQVFPLKMPPRMFNVEISLLLFLFEKKRKM
jgi:hypothetical protein